MNDVDYLPRTAQSKGTGCDHRLFFYDHASGRVHGRINYVYYDGTEARMSDSDVPTIRKAWHRQCRLNRARRAGRPYRHIIENRRITQQPHTHSK